MKKIVILCLILTVVMLSGCTGKKKPTDTNSTDSTIEIKPGLSDNIFDEDGNVIDGITTETPSSGDTTVSTNNATELDKKPQDYTYEEFCALSPAQQEACMESFDSVEDFFVWYNKVKAEYEASHPSVDVGDGDINLEDYLK